eukprot:g3101.t1
MEVVRDFGTAVARLSTYGLDEERVARLQESANVGHYEFLHKIHSLAVNRTSQQSFRAAIDELYRLHHPQEVSQPAGVASAGVVLDSNGGSAGVGEDAETEVEEEGKIETEKDAAGGSVEVVSPGERLVPRYISRQWSSIRGACMAGSLRTFKSLATGVRRPASEGTEVLSPLHSPWPSAFSPRPLSPEVDARDTVVPECGIKQGMEHTTFESKKHGFRLQVQGESVPPHPVGEQDSGPITVAPLRHTIQFEGGELEGVLEVHCLPSGRRFDAPLLLDFIVEPGEKDDPIMDPYGRIRYEVLTKELDPDIWARDRENSKPPEIIKDEQGRVYVRARVRHFSFWGLWKRKNLDFGPQLYHRQKIPFSQRKMHMSLIKNSTPGVDIHVFAMRKSQWSALKAVKAKAGAEGVEATIEYGTDVHEEVNPAILLPQMVTIPSGHSHWFEIPRVGAGILSSRKVVVVICTEYTDERDGRTMRMEAMEHLRGQTMLTVRLRVENGRVIGPHCAAESGGILSQVNRVIQNQYNAMPSGSSPTQPSQSQSQPSTNVGVTVSNEVTGAFSVMTKSSGAPLPADYDVFAVSDGDESSPGTAGGANNEAGDAARLTGSQLRGGEDATGSAPPQLHQILALMFTFLNSRGWCHCLGVSVSARDAVRALFSDLMPDGPRREEGWTVPLDVLTLKTDDAGVAHLAANECGITIHGAAESLPHLKAVIVPPPQSGFVFVAGEQYIATSPTLHCRWTGDNTSPNSSKGPWIVSFPLEEEEGLSNPTELSQVLRRGDALHDEWKVQTAGLKPATRYPSMQVEVTHFSDVMTADKLRAIEEKSTSIVYKRKRVWGTTLFSRHVHVYNASTKAMTVLQILPTVTESGTSGQVSLPAVGGGASRSRNFNINDEDGVNDWQEIPAWVNAGKEAAAVAAAVADIALAAGAAPAAGGMAPVSESTVLTVGGTAPASGGTAPAVGGTVPAAVPSTAVDTGAEPPTNPAKLRTLIGMRAMRVIPYTL